MPKNFWPTSLHGEPNDVAALLGLAEVAMTERNWPEATDYLAARARPGQMIRSLGLHSVNLELLRQDRKNAVTTATQLAEQFPTNPDVLDAKGRAQIASGDTEGAIATYKRIYGLSPNSIPAMAGYVALLNGAKEFSKAQTVLQAALARDPKNDPVKGDLIRVEAEISGMRTGLAKTRTLPRKIRETRSMTSFRLNYTRRPGAGTTRSTCSKRPSRTIRPPTP